MRCAVSSAGPRNGLGSVRTARSKGRGAVPPAPGAMRPANTPGLRAALDNCHLHADAATSSLNTSANPSRRTSRARLPLAAPPADTVGQPALVPLA